MMKKRYITFVAVLGGVIELAACGSDAASTATVAPVPPTTAAQPAAGASVAVKTGSSPFGQILVDASGNTLYAFKNDTNAQSTCTGTCAEAWPPALVTPTWGVAPGLDSGVFSTIIRGDGGEQLMAGRFPLYRFSGDARPGDFNGQGSGGVWFVVGSDAGIIEDAVLPTEPGTPGTGASPLVQVTEATLGQILSGEQGRTVYGFVKDADGVPTCLDGCTTAWPPVIVDPSVDLGSLPVSAQFSIVDRPDGSKQLKAGKWPLYYFSGDAVAGDTNGQGSGGNWFVLAADATLVK